MSGELKTKKTLLVKYLSKEPLRKTKSMSGLKLMCRACMMSAQKHSSQIDVRRLRHSIVRMLFVFSARKLILGKKSSNFTNR
jgi:hypothetical protein